MSPKTALIGLFAIAMFATATWVATTPIDSLAGQATPFVIVRR